MDSTSYGVSTPNADIAYINGDDNQMHTIELLLKPGAVQCSIVAANYPMIDASLSEHSLHLWDSWLTRYEADFNSKNMMPLKAIGREMAGWIDGDTHWLDNWLAQHIGDITLTIATEGQPSRRSNQFLTLPWELLCDSDDTFLIGDPARLFRVIRRIGKPATPAEPSYRDMMLLFMAADVCGQEILDYEAEEASILDATAKLPLHLIVEESGNLQYLQERLATETNVEALHLSCHGNIDESGPYLALETPEGNLARTRPHELIEVLGENRPALILLSACRTAGQSETSQTFVQSLIRSGVRNMVGWDGPVNDADATSFAKCFYQSLSHGSSTIHATAVAARDLYRIHKADPSQGKHWHLARLYIGPGGGGCLNQAQKPRRPVVRNDSYTVFLDKEKVRVPVASPGAFVGRRRQIQSALASYRRAENYGVLLHGMGHIGKSSLAARIASRMPHHRTIVLYSRYEIDTLWDRLKQAVPVKYGNQAVSSLNCGAHSDTESLILALQQLLEDAFACYAPSAGQHPILLIVDDLEQILDEPKPGQKSTTVRNDAVKPLSVILSAFARSIDATDSRLLLTSRYTFTLPDGRGTDLVDRLRLCLRLVLKHRNSLNP